MRIAICRLAMVFGVVAVLALLRLAPVQAQDGCPSGTTPVFNTATQSIVCIVDRDASCPPGQTPTYNTATQSIVCIGSGDGDDGRPPQAQCPSGQAALRTDDGTLRCVDLSLNPVHPCAAPDRAVPSWPSDNPATARRTGCGW